MYCSTALNNSGTLQVTLVPQTDKLVLRLFLFCKKGHRSCILILYLIETEFGLGTLTQTSTRTRVLEDELVLVKRTRVLY
jgi:hypothetical protein